MIRLMIVVKFNPLVSILSSRKWEQQTHQVCTQGRFFFLDKVHRLAHTHTHTHNNNNVKTNNSESMSKQKPNHRTLSISLCRTTNEVHPLPLDSNSKPPQVFDRTIRLVLACFTLLHLFNYNSDMLGLHLVPIYLSVNLTNKVLHFHTLKVVYIIYMPVCATCEDHSEL